MFSPKILIYVNKIKDFSYKSCILTFEQLARKINMFIYCWSYMELMINNNNNKFHTFLHDFFLLFGKNGKDIFQL